MADALPTLSELIDRALAARVADVHVSMPGEVVSYDAATQTASVRPCLRRVVLSTDDDQVAEDLPIIPNVPVNWQGCAALTLHGVLAEGDTGDLIFSSMSHNEWQASGRVSTPGDLKPHGLASAKFYPGLRHKKNAAPDTDNSIGVPGGLRLHFGASAISAGAGAHYVAMAQLVQARLDALASAISGWVPVPNDGGAALKAALGTWLGGSNDVASTNLKADP